MSVILPNIYADEKDVKAKGFFFYLLGPEKGSDDWHYQCYKKLEERLGNDFCAAIPVVYPDSHPLVKFRLKSASRAGTRLEWVRHYIEEAGVKYASKGCIIGYLPCESTTNPRNDGMPYAIKTRDVIGELRGRMMYDDRIRFVLGADKNFPGRDVIVRNFNKALENRLRVLESLDETVKAAIKMVSREPRPCMD